MATFGECLTNYGEFRQMLLNDFQDVVDSFSVTSSTGKSRFDYHYVVDLKPGLDPDKVSLPAMFRGIEIVPLRFEQ